MKLDMSGWIQFSQNFSSGGKGSLNELINHKAVYRTSPATPGLLKTQDFLRAFYPFFVILNLYSDERKDI
jgi:hypothetical protein